MSILRQYAKMDKKVAREFGRRKAEGGGFPIDTKDIRCFWRVYEEGSINRAAKQLFISPQGLSRVIQRLEEELGAPLFDRTQKGMAPTACGTYLYKNCPAFLRKFDEIEAGIRRIQEQDRQLRLGFSCGVLNVFPLHKLDLLQEHLGVPIRWDERDREEIIRLVLNGDCDAGFITGQAADPELWSKELYRATLNAIVCQGHPLYGRDSLSIGQLREERFITLTEKFDCCNSFIQRCRDFGFTPQIVIKTMEIQLIYRFCRQGLGIGIDVDIHQDEVSLSEIRRIPLADALPWKVSLLIRRDRMEERTLQMIQEMF